MKRTDPHRKGAIVPANYEHVISYNGATTENGWPVSSYGINCELDRRTEHKGADGKTVITNGKHDTNGLCCIIGLLHVAKVKFAQHGGNGQCTACGAQFVYGEVWKHVPTGEHIHVGNICSAKYGLVIDRSAFELAAGRHKAAAAVQIRRAQNAETRIAFLAEHPGLEEALNLEHAILSDMKARFKTYCSLSEKQIAFAFKLAEEIKNPKPKEKLVSAPVTDKRVTVHGKVVGLKMHEGYYGSTLKMTVKTETPKGAWLAWGTCPSSLDCERGDIVEFKARLKPGRDAHFALFFKPTQAVKC